MLKKTQLDHIKSKLLTERERFQESLHRISEQIFSEPDKSTMDSGDLASLSHDAALLYGLQESALARLRTIDEILLRIEKDHYGVCEQCGGAIGFARLDAIPWARNCRPCQEIADKKGTAA